MNWMSFLSSSQQCRSTEGNMKTLENDYTFAAGVQIHESKVYKRISHEWSIFYCYYVGAASGASFGLFVR